MKLLYTQYSDNQSTIHPASNLITVGCLSFQLERFSGKAKVVLFLVTDKDPKFIHPHTLLIDKAPVPGYHITDINGGEELE